jgi:hypothetical protein
MKAMRRSPFTQPVGLVTGTGLNPLAAAELAERNAIPVGPAATSVSNAPMAHDAPDDVEHVGVCVAVMARLYI